jgi:hypothetical protein|nr:MAG TPA: API3 pepsin inhibitor-3 [Caudoviricetes sp.]DAO60662.1 MAG TPA: API3 pepsin inhibitor-3 [Caudoviricetes sp.]DAS31385.1 MAG TPA: API3 pepsin inhibitor-3 [Caudoviricetes sp.]
MKPKRYPYSGKIRNREKTILNVGYISASSIKSNNSTITINEGKVFVNGENIRLNKGVE